MSNDSLVAWRRVQDLMEVVRKRYDLLEAVLRHVETTEALAEVDCAAEEAAYQAAIDAAMTAWDVVSAAEQTAEALDLAASIACQQLINCQQGQ